MAMFVRGLECCGLKELSGIQHSTSQAVFTSMQQYLGSTGGFITTEARNRAAKSNFIITQKLKSLWDKNALGTVVLLPVFRNPNTLNYIRMALWVPSRDSINSKGQTRLDVFLCDQRSMSTLKSLYDRVKLVTSNPTVSYSTFCANMRDSWLQRECPNTWQRAQLAIRRKK